MLRLELTLPTAAENVALDEALLELGEEGPADSEFLRIWESATPVAVVGRASRVAAEVEVTACERRGIPIIRRSSGGAAILAGPGCLMYAVVLSFARRPELRDISRAHEFVLEQTRSALRLCVHKKIIRAGTSDLAIADREASPAFAFEDPKSDIWRKFSGNSLRVKRTHVLYHGTLLYGFELALLESCLRRPPRQPEYRGGRGHGEFATNLPVARKELVDALDAAWPTCRELVDVPYARVRQLVETKFGQSSWNFEFA